MRRINSDVLYKTLSIGSSLKLQIDWEAGDYTEAVLSKASVDAFGMILRLICLFLPLIWVTILNLSAQLLFTTKA